MKTMLFRKVDLSKMKFYANPLGTADEAISHLGKYEMFEESDLKRKIWAPIIEQAGPAAIVMTSDTVVFWAARSLISNGLIRSDAPVFGPADLHGNALAVTPEGMAILPHMCDHFLVKALKLDGLEPSGWLLGLSDKEIGEHMSEVMLRAGLPHAELLFRTAIAAVISAMGPIQ